MRNMLIRLSVMAIIILGVLVISDHLIFNGDLPVWYGGTVGFLVGLSFGIYNGVRNER